MHVTSCQDKTDWYCKRLIQVLCISYKDNLLNSYFLEHYMKYSTILTFVTMSVDYTFSECREKMLSKVISPNGLLEEELKNNSELSAEWTQIKCNIFPGGLEEHTEALVTYSHAKRIFRQNFNKFVASKGGNMSLYQTEFFFKSLDFLLLDSMWLLNNGSDCRAVFRGTEKSYDATVGDKVRFGRFTSANTKRTDAVENCADGGTLFNIYTCSVVDLETYACLPDELELLISPLEVFSVVDVKTISDCDKVIVLNHTWSAPPPSGCILFPTLS
uniref:NAD(P)(+)--arginine ADP-ribosyltransferase n=1 Tax=Denticeps clupeoides TaxID=299321 RepID=A0AAY3ZZ56_9TELE